MIYYKYRSTLKFLLGLGFCPFTLNMSENRVQCSLWTKCYTLMYFLILSFISITSWYISTYAGRNVSDIFDNLYTISISFQLSVLIITHILNIFLSFIFREKHAQFLNVYIDAVKNMSHCNFLENPLPSKKYFLLFYFLGTATGIMFWNESFEISVLIFGIYFAFTLTSFMILTLYIRQLVLHLIEYGRQVTENLNSISNLNLSHIENCKKLLTCTEFAEEFFELKRLFNQSFDYHLLLNVINDVIFITISIYSILLEANVVDSVYCVILLLVPHIYKVIILVKSLDKLSDQVLFSYFCFNYN